MPKKPQADKDKKPQEEVETPEVEEETQDTPVDDETETEDTDAEETDAEETDAATEDEEIELTEKQKLYADPEEAFLGEDGEYDILTAVQTDVITQLGMKLSQKEVKAVLRSFGDRLSEATFFNGEAKIPDCITLQLQVVPEREGVTKITGEEKKWKKPAHYAVKASVAGKFKSWILDQELSEEDAKEAEEIKTEADAAKEAE